MTLSTHCRLSARIQACRCNCTLHCHYVIAVFIGGNYPGVLPTQCMWYIRTYLHAHVLCHVHVCCVHACMYVQLWLYVHYHRVYMHMYVHVCCIMCTCVCCIIVYMHMYMSHVLYYRVLRYEGVTMNGCEECLTKTDLNKKWIKHDLYN